MRWSVDEGVALAKSQAPLIKKSWSKVGEKSRKKDEHELPCRRSGGANEVHESESKESRTEGEKERKCLRPRQHNEKFANIFHNR